MFKGESKMTIEEMQEEIIQLEQGIAEYEEVIQSLERSNNKIEEMQSDTSMIDRETSDLIGNVFTSFKCDGVETKISPVLTELGTGNNHVDNKAYNDLENQKSDIRWEIEKRQNRIIELQSEIEMQQQLQNNLGGIANVCRF